METDGDAVPAHFAVASIDDRQHHWETTQCFFAAAGTWQHHEVVDGPVPVKVKGEEVVLFHRTDGAVAAQEDACLHRNTGMRDQRTANLDLKIDGGPLRFRWAPGKLIEAAQQQKVAAR